MREGPLPIVFAEHVCPIFDEDVHHIQTSDLTGKHQEGVAVLLLIDVLKGKYYS